MPEPYEYRDALPHIAKGKLRGRGAQLNPGNRYETTRLYVSGEHLDDLANPGQQQGGDVHLQLLPAAPNQTAGTTATEVHPDQSRTIINYVDPKVSPDIPFRWTINPYRGCEHGCIYCYARPFHEMLGFSCGLDFETKIMAKFDAPKLLGRELAKPSWRGDAIHFSGVTDCYQPIEADLKLTRACLEILADCCNPVHLITKNHLVTRDLDLFVRMNAWRGIHVAISLTTLDNRLASKLEPRASAPTDRLAAIRALADAGIPVSVMTAPIVPGLTDRELPNLLEAGADAGAWSAGYQLVRLPHQVSDLFHDWLANHFPDRASHIASLIDQARHGGGSACGAPSSRFRGRGALARQIHQVFTVFGKRHGLIPGRSSHLSSDLFRNPQVGGQMVLFG